MGMARRSAGPFRFLPLRFEEALFAKAYEQRIKCARFQPDLLRELISVLPSVWMSEHRRKECARLSRAVRLSGHGLISTYVEFDVKPFLFR